MLSWAHPEGVACWRGKQSQSVPELTVIGYGSSYQWHSPELGCGWRSVNSIDFLVDERWQVFPEGLVLRILRMLVFVCAITIAQQRARTIIKNLRRIPMKGLKKLVLASAIAAASSSSFAMQVMDDEAMSAATGQDGLTISIATAAPITGNIILHDTDGLTPGGAGDAGAIVIDGFSLTTSGIDLVIDAEGDTTTNDPYLNINVSIAAGTTIATGDISVASSNGLGAAVTNQTAVLVDSMNITLGATAMNIQLGNTPQGAMIALNTTMTGGLAINQFKLNDIAGGGSIAVDDITVRNAAGTDLDLDVDVSAVAGGLEITLNTVGTGGLYTSLEGVRLGTTDYSVPTLAPSIGDVEIIGLSLAGTTVTISGH
jgi:hypothetical protein